MTSRIYIAKNMPRMIKSLAHGLLDWQYEQGGPVFYVFETMKSRKSRCEMGMDGKRMRWVANAAVQTGMSQTLIKADVSA